MIHKQLPALAIFLVGIGIAWLVVRDAAQSDSELANGEDKSEPAKRARTLPLKLPENLGKREPQEPASSHDFPAIPNERIVQFSSEQAYRDALARLGDTDFKLLGRLDRYRALRLGGRDFSKLGELLGEEGTIGANHFVSLPLVPDPEASAGGVGFGASSFDFLNITGDNSEWGKGVTVAIIDTGVSNHVALPANIRQITVDGVSPDEAIHGHGNAVSSIVFGQHSRLRGLAPGSTPVSIRVAGSDGNSNSFLLAQGIIAALDAGASLINISMGSYGDSPLVRQAIAEAQDLGAVVVASPGNDGFPTAAFPAAYDGVISVGSIDATATHMGFSNQSDTLSISAPGYEVNAAWTGDAAIRFSGTSASAPFVTAALAAIISESPDPISGSQAAEILLSYANEAGPPGHDSSYGNGYLDVGRIMERNTPGITDLALSNFHHEPDSQSPGRADLQVNIENQGTEPVLASELLITLDGASFPIEIPRLSANQRHVATLPLGQNTGSLSVTGSLTPIGEAIDAQPANNYHAETIILQDAP